MTTTHASRTALATSLMRATHSRGDAAPLINDQWGDQLVPEAFRAAVHQHALDRMEPNARAQALAAPATTVIDNSLRASAAYADVILRARYTEDALQAAVERGVGQYVIIGAGFDSFAYRRPAWAKALKIYEVDHPATQTLKRQRLTHCEAAQLSSVHFVAADLSAETLGTALGRSAFQGTVPTFFSWLGVTMYLTREANLAALRSIASCALPGSELVFTYLDEAAFGSRYADIEALQQLKSRVSALGEAFLSGFDPASLGAQLQDTGMQLLEDLSGTQLVARYDGTGVNGLRSSALAHIAHARVISTHNAHRPV